MPIWGPLGPESEFWRAKKELGHAPGLISEPSRQPFGEFLVIKSYKKTSKSKGSILIGFLLHLGGPNPSKTLALCIQSRCRRFRSKVTFSWFLEAVWEVIGTTFAVFFDVISMSIFNASKLHKKVHRGCATRSTSISLGPLKTTSYPYILISLVASGGVELRHSKPA